VEIISRDWGPGLEENVTLQDTPAWGVRGVRELTVIDPSVARPLRAAAISEAEAVGKRGGVVTPEAVEIVKVPLRSTLLLPLGVSAKVCTSLTPLEVSHSTM